MSKRFLQLACSVVLAVAGIVFAGPAHGQRGPGGPPGGGGIGPGGGSSMMGGGGRGDFGHMGPDHDAGRYGSAAVHGPQLGPPGRWWDDKRLAKNLSLRTEQQRRMDDIFNTNKGQLLNLYANLQHEEAKLSSMSPADLQDETKVFAGIDRVAQARAELEKENAHILLQIRHELDGEQLGKLDHEIAALR